MIRCFIVDDEPLARHGLERLLLKTDDFLPEFLTGNPSDAIRQIESNPPDLVFLDVRMPGLDGISILKRLMTAEGKKPYVILVTAFNDHAVEAFEYEALDYLVKPFDDERFHRSLERARKRIQNTREHATPSAQPRAQRNSKLRFKVRDAEVILPASEICWVESSGHYILIHTGSRTYLVRKRLVDAESELEPHGFIRVHRTAIINPIHISEIRCREQSRTLLLSDGSEVAVSRRRWRDVGNLV